MIDPVLVIGAGLSAADAIMAARFRGIPVLHAFRDSSNEWKKPDAEKTNAIYDRLQGLSSSIYPEYHKVYEMMADGGTNYPLYRALPGYALIRLGANRDDFIGDAASEKKQMVTLSDPDGCAHTFRVSVVAILIGTYDCQSTNVTKVRKPRVILEQGLEEKCLFVGYKPDLSYLKADGVGLGKYPDKPIDGKSNPIEVDDFTYEVTKAPTTGLYALGPLVGDNFVRYILGGAFGILVHILNTSFPT